ncbi:hypothetical protein RND81_09G112300 [Saponaria officinalis]|uniref:Phytocyanin domain-containing protein n=1 Tax=Saponaria officinalis TaxID=3572 RepID=A0AAW1IKR9_SAPOF
MDLRKMCFVMFFIVFSLMINFENGVMAFKEVKVGGVHGWSVPPANDTQFYDNWAATKRFHVGDSLLFEYKNDTVLVVDKYGYYHCDLSKATSTFNDGNTTIKLEHPGLAYFISGSFDHCAVGQRLQLVVMSPHAPQPVASPPEDHHHAEAPSPGAPPKSDGSHVQASLFVGLGLIVSMLLV